MAARIVVLAVLLVGAARLLGLASGMRAPLAAWRTALSAALLLAFLWYTGAQKAHRSVSSTKCYNLMLFATDDSKARISPVSDLAASITDRFGAAMMGSMFDKRLYSVELEARTHGRDRHNAKFTLMSSTYNYRVGAAGHRVWGAP